MLTNNSGVCLNTNHYSFIKLRNITYKYVKLRKILKKNNEIFSNNNKNSDFISKNFTLPYLVIIIVYTNNIYFKKILFFNISFYCLFYFVTIITNN